MTKPPPGDYEKYQRDQVFGCWVAFLIVVVLPGGCIWWLDNGPEPWRPDVGAVYATNGPANGVMGLYADITPSVGSDGVALMNGDRVRVLEAAITQARVELLATPPHRPETHPDVGFVGWLPYEAFN